MATATYSSSSSSLFCRCHDTGGKWRPLVSKRWSINASISRRSQKAPRRLIKIGTSDRRWHGKWTCDYVLSLRDLRLLDLVEDDQKDAKVLVNLSIEKDHLLDQAPLLEEGCLANKTQEFTTWSVGNHHVQHAGFGLSIDGKITTSFTRKCSNCSSPYCREVIYVKPGYEAHLDPLIQDSLRLTTSVKDTCSESCEKSEPTIQYIGGPKAASVDKRWGRLLELKNTNR